MHQSERQRYIMTQMEHEKKGGKIFVHVPRKIEHLIPGFLENRVNDVNNIKEALSHRDYEAVRRLGHSMEGCGNLYRFYFVTDIGNSIQKAAQHRDYEEVCSLITELSDILEHIEIVYE